MPRNFLYPETDAACEDPRCRSTSCKLASEAAEFRKNHPSLDDRRWRALIEGVARDALDLMKNVRNPSPSRLEKAMEHAFILKEAKLRFENSEYKHWSQISN